MLIVKYEHTPSLQRLYLSPLMQTLCKISGDFLEIVYSINDGTAITAGTMYLDNALFNDDGEQLPKQ